MRELLFRGGGEEDEWHYWNGVLIKYHFNFVANNSYIYSEDGINDEWFEEVIRCKKKK